MTIQPLPSDSLYLVPYGLTRRDQCRIQEALDSSTTANTRRPYGQSWNWSKTWMAGRGHVPALLVSPAMVAAFLSQLAEQGLSVATLRLRNRLWGDTPLHWPPRPRRQRWRQTGHGRHCQARILERQAGQG